MKDIKKYHDRTNSVKKKKINDEKENNSDTKQLL